MQPPDEQLLCMCVCLFVSRFHRGQAVFLESKESSKVASVIVAVGIQEVRRRLGMYVAGGVG